MKSVIREIFEGKRGHADTLKLTEAYSKISEKASDIYELIREDLSEEQKSNLFKLCELYAELEAEGTETHFVEGVKLGILLGAEAFSS